MSMMETLQGMCKEVNRRIDTDPRVRDVAKEKDRLMVLEFTDERTYTLEVRDGRMLEPREGSVEAPTIKVVTDTQTFEKVLSKKMNPLMAYAMKKIKAIGPLDEVMVLKDFL
jgi:putative sterol carrier protein